MNKVLFISVHPDDETLGCGGTILKHKANNDEIFWLILTKGNQKIESIENFNDIRNKYIQDASIEYGFDKTYKLNFLTTELDIHPLGEIISEIKQVISLIKPDIVFIPNRSDVQSDHRIAFEAIYACTKNFRAPFIKKLLMYETLSETEYAPALRENSFTPNIFVDITPFINKKLEIMKIYKSEVMDEPYPRAMSSIKALNRFRGSRIGVKYAESFMLLFEML